MFAITYSTVNLKGNPNQFYIDVANATDKIVSIASSTFKEELDSYTHFIKKSKIESLRSYNEYLLELIMLGVLWRSNESNIRRSPMIVEKLLNKLYLIRKRNTSIKPNIDQVRGFLISNFLYSKAKHSLKHDLRSFRRFLVWLDASGEYAEESKRLKGWLMYANTLRRDAVVDLIVKTYQFSKFFEEVCSETLSSYTMNVNRFVERAKVTYKNREDYSLVTRKEIEYHLNMIGAEILNRELRADFENAKTKVVLLPTCMRSIHSDDCKAIDNGLEKKCIGCNPNCNAGKVTLKFKEQNIETYLIPHSSDFSKFLEKWKDKPDTALVGVACVLNLLTGGYEMINLGIASQCVYLDHCGCRKHWDMRGVSTSINIEQLQKIVKPVSANDRSLYTNNDRSEVA